MLLGEYKDLADYCVREARRLGAQYAEARVHGGTGTGFLLKNGEPTLVADLHKLLKDKSPDVVIQVMLTAKLLKWPDAETIIRTAASVR